MKTSLFDFHLPPERIAQTPAEPRDSARMLDMTGGTNIHRLVRDLPACLRAGDILVCNDTRVVPFRLSARRGQARVEVTLHKRIGPGECWRAFARPARKLSPGDRLDIAEGFHAMVCAKTGGEVDLAFDLSGTAFWQALELHGRTPLPPYIARGGDPAREAADRDSYQTVFARENGAVAAPTAGLHFTASLLEALRDRGISMATLTLHVGAGTFLPVRVEDTDDHRMHAEYGRLSAETAARITAARAAGGRVIAIGTTTLRLLESAAAGGSLQPFDGETDIFITPGYRFRAVDMLLTNFHLPRSTLYMLVCAFAGTGRVHQAYAEAIEQRYRFYSYGDCCLMKHDNNDR